ncbi:MAG: polyvinylalcohol dehydrogenase [Planctomycetia bacterium]|nr:polyvinylalcohol dehydrogenase [Planctomycetia bacterium]
MFRFCLAALLAVSIVCAADPNPNEPSWPTFRGPKRDNISPDTGLLKEWPEGGPKLLWSSEGVGKGYASVTVAAGKVFTMGTADGKTWIYAIDAVKGGEPIWKAEVGIGGSESYKGSRCTPTYDDGLVYGIGSAGDLVCVTADKGEEKWRKSFKKDYKGASGGWQFSESPLIDGDRLVCTPGGKDATIVCFDKKTGKEIWKSAAGGTAGYASIVIGNAGGVKQYVTLIGAGTVGVDAKDGKLLWTYSKFAGNTANIPSPVPLGDKVFTTAGYGKPMSLIELKSADGKFTVEPIYEKGSIGNRLGGVVVLGDLVFSDQDMSGNLYCADWKTGEIKWRRNDVKGKTRGTGSSSAALAYADGYLYVHYQNGVMALVPATDKGYEEKGSFKVPGSGRSESWAHPVVIGGKLYLREDSTVHCYDVKAK